MEREERRRVVGRPARKMRGRRLVRVLRILWWRRQAVAVKDWFVRSSRPQWYARVCLKTLISQDLQVPILKPGNPNTSRILMIGPENFSRSRAAAREIPR